jgi:hypothetical protein
VTPTTYARQIKLLIEGMLRTYGIDNLKLEMDLSAGIKSILESEEPARTRESYLETIRVALGKNVEQQAFDEMIETQFKRFPLNWTPFAENEKEIFRVFLRKQDTPLAKFIDWWTQDEWRLSHPPQRLDKIMIMWPQAFTQLPSEGRKLERL